jgi:hypothetical protein
MLRFIKLNIMRRKIHEKIFFWVPGDRSGMIGIFLLILGIPIKEFLSIFWKNGDPISTDLPSLGSIKRHKITMRLHQTRKSNQEKSRLILPLITR